MAEHLRNGTSQEDKKRFDRAFEERDQDYLALAYTFVINQSKEYNRSISARITSYRKTSWKAQKCSI